MLVSSPRTWGCFYLNRAGYKAVVVFPTYVGVFLRKAEFMKMAVRLPHVRGGVSGFEKK